MSESENEPENVEIHTEKPTGRTVGPSLGAKATTETMQITEICTKPKKVKKPRSDAQKKAFEKAVATRRANQKRQADARKAKKEVAQVESMVADRSSDDEEEVVVKRRSKKKKPRRRIVYEDSSSSEEETVAVVKRRKKKKKPEVLYESDIEEADEPAPAPAPAPVYVPRMPQFQLV